MGCGCSIFHRNHEVQPPTDNLPLDGHLQPRAHLVPETEDGRHGAPGKAGGPMSDTPNRMVIDHDGAGDATIDRQAPGVDGDGTHGAPGVVVMSSAIVLPTNAKPISGPVEDDRNLTRLRAKCPRFRVLVIGKANAGKTTILQKMCNTTEKPIIRDKTGNVIDQSIVQPTDGRGIHDINNELTFSSNPNFVFHDSAGFEAASVAEVENVREFIARRATGSELSYQLHAIWYCLPLDNDRPLCDAEMRFFEHGTGKAPVIAIFTKFDGMILKEYNRLRFEEACSKKEASEKAAVYAEKTFQESKFYIKRLREVPHPPARAVRLQDMHKPGNNCIELGRQTLEALDSKILQLLFVSVQQNNLGLSAEYAIENFMLKALSHAQEHRITPSALAEMAKNMMACYRHMLWDDEDYSVDDPRGLSVEERRDYGREKQINRGVQTTNLDDVFVALEPTILPWIAQDSSSYAVFLVGIAILILTEDSFWPDCKQGTVLETIKLALKNYQSSNRHAGVVQEISTRFGEADIQDLVTNKKDMLVKMVVEVVQKFKAPA